MTLSDISDIAAIVTAIILVGGLLFTIISYFPKQLRKLNQNIRGMEALKADINQNKEGISRNERGITQNRNEISQNRDEIKRNGREIDKNRDEIKRNSQSISN